jgi:O-antigen ligase
MPIAFALLLPLVFLHADLEPSWTVGQATLYLSDLAVLAIGGLGLVAGLRTGFAPLRPGRAVWTAASAFLAVVLWGTLWGALRGNGYDTVAHFLTAAKFAEYGLIAFAVPLVLRTPRELVWPLAVLTAWSCAATFDGVLQFLGIVDEFVGRRPGQREPSFLGTHDFAALSGATLSLAFLALAFSRRDRLAAVAGPAGALGVVIAGATTAVVGVAAAATAAWLLGRRRALALTAIVLVVGSGTVAIRAADTRPLLDLLGIEHPRTINRDPEASWQQRFALGYIGIRIFLDHPLLGVGWQASKEEPSYAPYLDDARERFPDLPELALPAPEHPWGVQNAYLQAAADLGIVGLAAFLAFLLVPLRTAWRAGAAGAVPMLWLLVAMGVWLGIGLVAGIPLVGLTWLSIGLAAAAASWREPV